MVLDFLRRRRHLFGSTVVTNVHVAVRFRVVFISQFELGVRCNNSKLLKVLDNTRLVGCPVSSNEQLELCTNPSLRVCGLCMLNDARLILVNVDIETAKAHGCRSRPTCWSVTRFDAHGLSLNARKGENTYNKG